VPPKHQATEIDSENDDSRAIARQDEEILEIARKRFDLAAEAEAEIRKEALDDLKFSAGEQWPEDVKRAREQDRRPCITINRLPQFIRQITNDQRQNRPSIKVSPVDDKADLETAKIYQGLIRHIEYASNADTAYDTAFDSAVRASFGFFRVVTDYCDPFSFEQEIRILRVPDRFSCYLDPSYREPDGSDANWGFAFEDISIDEYKAHYPKSKLASMSDWASLGQSQPDWATSSTVRVAEYFYREYREATICQLSDGSTIEKDKLPKAPSMMPMGLEIVAERVTQIPTIKWCKINGVEILERTDWPGKWIPIIPVLGEELIVDGKRILSGVIRHAKDPQRMYNYWKSSETETIALAPRAPFIGYAGQFEGFEAQWKTANVRNHAYLEVNPKTINGEAAPLPQRNVFEPPVQAITQASMFAAEDLKATTGIYDAALGAKSNEQSGIAIQRRNIQAQTSNFHFIDNLSKSIRHCGRIIVDLIPHIYDTPRAARILGEDGTEEIVRLNEQFLKNGKLTKYNFGVGKYDVTVDTGPSFETRRQEAVASMADLTRSYPQIMQVAGDLMVKNMDWPGASEIAERLKKTLPPGVADDKSQKPVPPEIQQQMTQMNQMIEQLTASLNEANGKIQNKTLELESRERIENARLQIQAEIELAKMGSVEAIALLKQEIAEIKTREKLLRNHLPINFENEIGAGPFEAVTPNEQQPTGGFSPGQPMGSMNHVD